MTTGYVPIDWSKRLSPAQLDAATRLDAPVCILAGAGSGKTRAITHRIAYLVLEKRVQPERILAVTFTNKAAGEMKERVHKLVGSAGFKAQVGTFHGLAARILRRWGRSVNVLPSFVIYDADDYDRLITRICTNDVGLEKEAAAGIGALIESWQSEGLAPADVPKGHDLQFEQALQVYGIARKKLDEMGALDFGGLLMKWRDLLKSEAAPFVKAEVKHILVDEYQDVNAVQAEIVLEYARAAESCAVVGDDDQAIYGWRGASASNLKKFLDKMPGARLVKLEENYRSTATILEAANGIIAHNQVRLGKVLKPTGERGRPVQVVRAHSDLDEAAKIVRLVMDDVRAGTSLEEIAILYRTNAFSRTFEDELRMNHLPYRIIGGMRFYDRKEVKDVLATLRCALNPQSDVDTLRFLAAVPRGIGDATVKKAEEAARRANTSLLLALAKPDVLGEVDLDKAKITRCATVAEAVRELGRKIARTPQPLVAQGGLFDTGAPSALTAKDAVALAVQVSGVADRLQAEGGIEAEGRLENLGELVNAAAEHAERAKANGDPDDVQSFLESAALLSSADEGEGDREKLTLMTLHAAKGLELDVVYMVGLEELGLPHARAVIDESGDEMEEERRLAYVGITRARRRLVFSYAMSRMVQGQKKQRAPSRFLAEVPREVLAGDLPPKRFHPDAILELTRRPYVPPTPSSEMGASHVVYDEDAPERARFVRPSRRVVLTEPGFVPDGDPVRATVTVDADVDGDTDVRAGDGGILKGGTRVWHKSFGAGVVVGPRGSGHNASALVRFDDQRAPRTIIARHLRTEPVEE